MPFVPSSVLAPGSKARSPIRSVLLALKLSYFAGREGDSLDLAQSSVYAVQATWQKPSVTSTRSIKMAKTTSNAQKRPSLVCQHQD